MIKTLGIRASFWLAPNLLLAAFIVKGTRIGPVIGVISEKRGWGVHTGDLLALLPLTIGLLGTIHSVKSYQGDSFSMKDASFK